MSVLASFSAGCRLGGQPDDAYGPTMHFETVPKGVDLNEEGYQAAPEIVMAEAEERVPVVVDALRTAQGGEPGLIVGEENKEAARATRNEPSFRG